jgi:branched-chain amino acid transport system permease protein
MQNFAQLLVGGISLGAVYALLALGFVLVFKATGVINFAYPALLLAGAYVASQARTKGGLPFPLAVVLGICAAVVIAALVDRVLVRRMQGGGSVIAVSIMTIGVGVVLQTEIIRRIGIDVLPIGDPWGSRVVTVGGLTIPQTRIAALVVGLALIACFFVWFKFSVWGVAMRAAAEDHETAALMGIRGGRISAASWAVAGGLAAVAGLFITMFPSPGLEPTTSAVALRAFPAAIIGGLDSTGGAVVGGLIIGVTEVLTQGYEGHLTFLGLGFHAVMPYLVMVLVLLVRPTGLFGTRELHRV